jgi:hypothetical protein
LALAQIQPGDQGASQPVTPETDDELAGALVYLVGGDGFANFGAVKMETFDFGGDEEPLRLSGDGCGGGGGRRR